MRWRQAPATPAEPTRAELEARIAQLSSELETAPVRGSPTSPRSNDDQLDLVGARLVGCSGVDLGGLGARNTVRHRPVHGCGRAGTARPRRGTCARHPARRPGSDRPRSGDQGQRRSRPIQERVANEIARDVGQGGVVRTAIEQRLSGALDNWSEHRRRRRGGLRSAIDAIVGSDQFENLLVEATARAQPRRCPPPWRLRPAPQHRCRRGQSHHQPAAAVGRGVEECGRARLDLLGIDATIPTIDPGEGARGGAPEALDRPRLRATSGLRADHGDGRRHPRRVSGGGKDLRPARLVAGGDHHPSNGGCGARGRAPPPP